MQVETRIIWIFGFGAYYIRDFTVYKSLPHTRIICVCVRPMRWTLVSHWLGRINKMIPAMPNVSQTTSYKGTPWRYCSYISSYGVTTAESSHLARCGWLSWMRSKRRSKLLAGVACLTTWAAFFFLPACRRMRQLSSVIIRLIST